MGVNNNLPRFVVPSHHPIRNAVKMRSTAVRTFHCATAGDSRTSGVDFVHSTFRPC